MNEIDFKKIGLHIRELRQKENISQLKLCLRADLSLDTIRLLENGKKRKLEILSLQKICHAFDIKLWELLKEFDI